MHAIEQAILTIHSHHQPSHTTPSPQKPLFLTKLFRLKSILAIFYIRTLHYCRNTHIHDLLCSMSPDHLHKCIYTQPNTSNHDQGIPTIYLIAHIEFDRPCQQHQHTSHHITFPNKYVGSTQRLFGTSNRFDQHITNLWHHRLDLTRPSKSPQFHNPASTLSTFYKLIAIPLAFAPYATAAQLRTIEHNHFIPSIQPLWNGRPSIYATKPPPHHNAENHHAEPTNIAGTHHHAPAPQVTSTTSN
jgi:hypothetical protein